MGRPLLRWLPAFVTAATVLYTLSVYPDLPARMPTHWGINGQPNGWSSREFGAWLLPGMMGFMWLMFLVVPRKPGVGVVVDVMASAILSFQAIIQHAMLSVAQGHAVDMNSVVYVALGALFVILGTAIPKGAGLLLICSGVLTAYCALTSPPHTTFVIFLSSSIAASLGSMLLALHWRQR